MSATQTLPPTVPQYAWELATLYPEQGQWTEEEYLDLTNRTHRPIEFVDGRLEFPPVPTEIHQELLKFLFLALHQFVERQQLGAVHFAGIRLRVRPGKIREPDIVFLRKENFHQRHNRMWHGADLVMEVVSDDPHDRERDYHQKLADYAAAGVAEYWIIDYARQVVVVYRLAGSAYVAAGEYTPGKSANSILLPGFAIDVGTLFGTIGLLEDESDSP